NVHRPQDLRPCRHGRYCLSPRPNQRQIQQQWSFCRHGCPVAGDPTRVRARALGAPTSGRRALEVFNKREV
ncbi:hypothetical protein BGX30_012251, partial [Mortierella sp. GBA39]